MPRQHVPHSRTTSARLADHVYLTQFTLKVMLQESIPRQFRQRFLHISNSKEKVDGFVEELTSTKRP